MMKILRSAVTEKIPVNPMSNMKAIALPVSYGWTSVGELPAMQCSSCCQWAKRDAGLQSMQHNQAMQCNMGQGVGDEHVVKNCWKWPQAYL
jgi:hypothetical protein